MRISTLPLIAAIIIIIPLIDGCASQRVVLAPVGPAPARNEDYVSMGYLKVFSATETHAVGDSTFYYPHTGYSIMSDSGKILKYVINHVGTMDESPSIVTVPAGQYNIVAEAEGYGRVTVPVVIRGGRTTMVHLERDWKPAPNTSKNVVRLPDGDAVGWGISTNS